jgi:hypothetical protein
MYAGSWLQQMTAVAGGGLKHSNTKEMLKKPFIEW